MVFPPHQKRKQRGCPEIIPPFYARRKGEKTRKAPNFDWGKKGEGSDDYRANELSRATRDGFFTRIHRAKLEASKHREKERERSLQPENQGGGFNAASMQHQGRVGEGKGGREEALNHNCSHFSPPTPLSLLQSGWSTFFSKSDPVVSLSPFLPFHTHAHLSFPFSFLLPGWGFFFARYFWIYGGSVCGIWRSRIKAKEEWKREAQSHRSSSSFPGDYSFIRSAEDYSRLFLPSRIPSE